MTQSESLKDVLSSIFRRRGGLTPRTLLFQESLNPAQAIMIRLAKLGPEELPILSCAVDDEQWVLLTTERLFHFDADKLKWIENREITDATVDIVRDMAGGARTKQDCKTIVVALRSGLKHRIEFESGPPLIGFWNVLKHLAVKSGPAAQ